MLRKISGLIQCKEGWKIRNNQELEKLITGEDINESIKAERK
jgi:hypothetical protein